ncbi:hypothetical protein BJL95_02050 [Methylomonas sp. LWB]|nr:hypothetical protein BJL95_02050 [Methylomonas sp. LWB]
MLDNADSGLCLGGPSRAAAFFARLLERWRAMTRRSASRELNRAAPWRRPVRDSIEVALNQAAAS